MKILASLSLFIFIALGVAFVFKGDHQNEEIVEEEYTQKVETPIVEAPPKKPLRKEVEKKRPIKKRIKKKDDQISLQNIVKVPTLKKVSNPTYSQKDFSYVDPEGNLYVESVIIDGEDAVSFGDVLIGNAQEIILKAQKGESVSIHQPEPWPDGIIYYEIDEELPNPDRVLSVMNHMVEVTHNHLKFVEKGEEQKDFLFFTRGAQNCYSYVGKVGGKQKVSLSDRCAHKEILHELMHAIGFFHEQNREDRDNFIEVHMYNIDEKFHPQFKKIPNSWQHLFNSDFDFESIMLYPPTAFSMYEDDYAITTVAGDPYEVNRGNLSEIDIARIKALYPKQHD